MIWSKRDISSATRNQNTGMGAEPTGWQVLVTGKRPALIKRLYLQGGTISWGRKRLLFSTEERLQVVVKLIGSCMSIALSMRKLQTPSTQPRWVYHKVLPCCACHKPNNQETPFESACDFLQNALNQKENWVLCRIFSKKRSCKTDEEVIRVNNAEMVHAPQTNNNQSPVSSSSSCSSSSGITEVTSSSEAGDEEEISGCTKFRSC